jgi:hypothetical protein
MSGELSHDSPVTTDGRASEDSSPDDLLIRNSSAPSPFIFCSPFHLIPAFFVLLAFCSILLALSDISWSVAYNVPPGDLLAYLAAYPSARSITVRRLCGIVDFDAIGTDSRHTFVFPDVSYGLPQWWIVEYVPASHCSELILRDVDVVASELWVERLAIACALAREGGAGADSQQCERWEVMEGRLKMVLSNVR